MWNTLSNRITSSQIRWSCKGLRDCNIIGWGNCEFMPQCEPLQGCEVSILKTNLKDKCRSEWRGNGHSSLQLALRYSCNTLTVYTRFKLFLQKAPQSQCVQQSTAQRMDVCRKYSKWNTNINAACGLMRTRAEKLNCLGLFSLQSNNTMTRTGNWQSNNIVWVTFLAIYHFLTVCSVPLNCNAPNEKHWNEFTGMFFFLLDQGENKKQNEMFSSGSITQLKQVFPFSFRQENFHPFPCVLYGKVSQG